MYSDEEGESLQELDFDPEDIEQIDTTDEAEVIGDQYLPII